jgi:hypothetical protein
MNDKPRAAEPPGVPDIFDWRQVLDDVERSLRDAGRAIALLRYHLDAADSEQSSPGGAPQRAEAPAPPREPRLAQGPPQQTEAPAPAPGPPAPDEKSARHSPFERLWDRIEAERLDQQSEGVAEGSSELRGLDLLPQQYLVTVEDRESAVALAPLHRALAAVADMDDVSLLSFANGVPVISVRVQGELDLERLREAVSVAMDRDCEMIPQDNGRLHLRLSSLEGGGG